MSYKAFGHVTQGAELYKERQKVNGKRKKVKK